MNTSEHYLPITYNNIYINDLDSFATANSLQYNFRVSCLAEKINTNIEPLPRCVYVCVCVREGGGGGSHVSCLKDSGITLM